MGHRDQLRAVFLRGRLLRIGLILLGAGGIAILGSCPIERKFGGQQAMVAIFVGAATAIISFLCCAVALIVRLVRRQNPVNSRFWRVL
jgi:hypothetical protein